MKVHIGSVIEKKYQESGLKITAFADAIDTSDRNVYSLFKREDCSANMLVKISKALNFNFFQLYHDTLPETMLEETAPEYGSGSKKIAVSLTLSSTPDNYLESFGELLKALMVEANKHGFSLV